MPKTTVAQPSSWQRIAQARTGQPSFKINVRSIFKSKNLLLKISLPSYNSTIPRNSRNWDVEVDNLTGDDYHWNFINNRIETTLGAVAVVKIGISFIELKQAAF